MAAACCCIFTMANTTSLRTSRAAAMISCTRISLLSLLLALAFTNTRAFTQPSLVARRATGTNVAFTTFLKSQVDSFSLEGMPSDHEAEGTAMAESIAAWLDSEVRATRTYLFCVACLIIAHPPMYVHSGCPKKCTSK